MQEQANMSSTKETKTKSTYHSALIQTIDTSHQARENRLRSAGTLNDFCAYEPCFVSRVRLLLVGWFGV